MHAALLCLFLAQAPPPDYQALSGAYEALRTQSYEIAIAGFETALRHNPGKAATHKDLAYTLLKIGENEQAREHFRLAMELDGADTQSTLEYAFLSFESSGVEGGENALTRKATARRIFDRLRHQGNTTAEQAFQNIDGPLADGIARWKAALTSAPETFSAHFELGQLAEQRDELELASAHYLAAWKMLPARKSVLLDLGRVQQKLHQTEQANASLLAASRGGEPRAAEQARELLPGRYPYVYEFRNALALDPQNAELQRELAYLLLSMGEKDKAEQEFAVLLAAHPNDLLSAAQLGFLYLGRKDSVRAMPLLKLVLAGNDHELSEKVRTALQLPPELQTAEHESEANPYIMADRSFKAGYLKDALRYFKIAQEADSANPDIMLKLGWTYNMLHDDRSALQWFDQARHSSDTAVAKQAKTAYNALRPSLAPFQTTVWLFPFYSSRWHDAFAYGQIKTEWNTSRLPFHPYVSLRMIGDTGPTPASLSEKSFVAAIGARTEWHHITAWAEAGKAISYVKKEMLPDYRGGLAWARGWGTSLLSEKPGFFAETNADEVFVSRFQNDMLTYSQTRFGYTRRPVQFLFHTNFTVDTKRQYWANYAEAGPGIRFHIPGMPNALLFSVSCLRGVYLVNAGNPRRPNFTDVRAGFWYAISH